MHQLRLFEMLVTAGLSGDLSSLHGESQCCDDTRRIPGKKNRGHINASDVHCWFVSINRE
jgi:hypothetical protein